MAKDVIARLKADTSQWDGNLKRAGSSIEQMVQSSIGTLGKLAGAWLTVEGAVKAFDKIVAGSQTTTDAWGRTMQASTRVVDSFFESLSQGSFQSFLSGLDNIIDKARAAYDAIDALGTYDIFSGPLKAKYEAEIRKLRFEIRAGVGDPNEKKAQLRAVEEQMLSLATRESSLSEDAARKTLASFTNSKMGTQMLEELFLSGDQAQNVALGMFERLKREQSSTKLVDTVIGTTSWGGQVWGKKEVTQWNDENTKNMAESLLKFGEMGDELLQQVANLYIRKYRAMAEVYAKKQENLETLNFKGAGGGSASYTSTLQAPDIAPLSMDQTSSMSELKARQAEVIKAIETATNSEALRAAEQLLTEIQNLIIAQPIALRLDVPEEEIAKIQKDMTDLGDKMRENITPLDESMIGKGYSNNIKSTDKQVTDMGAHVTEAATAIGNMGSALQMINDPGLQAAGLVMGAIASVASSFAMALSKESVNVWTWIAAAIAGTATMVSTIASIKSATAGSYADGGVVTGGPFTGDAIPIMANAGEVILNASQQSNLARQLQPRDMGGNRQPYVSGELLYLGLNNHLRRTGKGELVTSKR